MIYLRHTNLDMSYEYYLTRTNLTMNNHVMLVLHVDLYEVGDAARVEGLSVGGVGHG